MKRAFIRTKELSYTALIRQRDEAISQLFRVRRNGAEQAIIDRVEARCLALGEQIRTYKKVHA